MNGTIYNDRYRIKALEDAVEDVQDDVGELQTLATAPLRVRTYTATVTCEAGSYNTINVSTTESSETFANYTKVAVAGVYLSGTGYNTLVMQGFRAMQSDDVVYVRVRNTGSSDVTAASVEVKVLYAKTSLLG